MMVGWCCAFGGVAGGDRQPHTQSWQRTEDKGETSELGKQQQRMRNNKPSVIRAITSLKSGLI
jgi:hypothetical protein